MALIERYEDASLKMMLELDKGLRSDEIGKQCEAIVKFGELMEQWPLPSVVNTSVLKLADVFRESNNNLVRYWILRVILDSEQQLRKVVNIDEVVKRVFVVLQSNDPIARVLTLRLLGAMAHIIAERSDVHHGIRTCLSSHTREEVDAAIYAIDRICAHSPSFSRSMLHVIAALIEGHTTSPRMKLKLIRVLQRMSHDVHMATVTRDILIRLTDTCPTQTFVTVVLNTLTHLAARSLLLVADQISLLLNYVFTDPRQIVKLTALKNLRILAKDFHYCSFKLKELIEFFEHSEDHNSHEQILNIMLLLLPNMAIARDIETLKASQSYDSAFIKRVRHLLFASPSKQVVHLCARVLAMIVANHTTQQLSSNQNLEDEVVAAMCVRLITEQTLPVLQALTRVTLTCASVKTSQRHCYTIIQSVISLMSRATGQSLRDLCQFLIKVVPSCPQVILKYFLELQTIVMRHIGQSVDDENDIILAKLCTVLLSVDDEPCLKLAADVVEHLMSNKRLWPCYKIGCVAANNSRHEMGHSIFSQLTQVLSASKHLNWFKALTVLTSTMANKQNKIEVLTNQLAGCLTLLSSIDVDSPAKGDKASLSGPVTFTFQREFVNLKLQQLRVNNKLQSLIATYPLSPLAPKSLVEYATHELKAVAGLYRQLGGLFQQLAQKRIDIDETSFDVIEALQYVQLTLAAIIDTFVTKETQNKSTAELVFTQLPKNSSSKLMSMCRTILSHPSLTSGTSNMTEALAFLKSAVTQLEENSKSVPLMFFSTRVATVIDLSITPSPAIPGEVLVVEEPSDLVLNISGLILRDKTHVPPRKISHLDLDITITSLEEETRQPLRVKALQDSLALSTALLHFPSTGLHRVTVASKIVDSSQRKWLGPSSSFVVNYHGTRR